MTDLPCPSMTCSEVTISFLLVRGCPFSFIQTAPVCDPTNTSSAALLATAFGRWTPHNSVTPLLPTVGVCGVLFLYTKRNFDNVLFTTETEACPATCVARSALYSGEGCGLKCAKSPPWIRPAVYPGFRLSSFSFMSCAIKQDARLPLQTPSQTWRWPR
jgi:hypothetical protein